MNWYPNRTFLWIQNTFFSPRLDISSFDGNLPIRPQTRKICQKSVWKNVDGPLTKFWVICLCARYQGLRPNHGNTRTHRFGGWRNEETNRFFVPTHNFRSEAAKLIEVLELRFWNRGSWHKPRNTTILELCTYCLHFLLVCKHSQWDLGKWADCFCIASVESNSSHWGAGKRSSRTKFVRSDLSRWMLVGPSAGILYSLINFQASSLVLKWIEGDVCVFFHESSHQRTMAFTIRKLTWLAGKSTVTEDVFPIEHGDFPMSCWFSWHLCCVTSFLYF